jgi:arylsulfatase A-like enzyme
MSDTNNWQYLAYVLAAFAFITVQCGEAEVASNTDSTPGLQRPNIVFILADDMGWNEASFNGADCLITPHINKLRNENVSLTQFYVHAVCAPNRAAFLTGKYPFRTWSDWRSEDFGKPSYLEKLDLELATNEEGDLTRRIHGLPTNEITIAEALRDLGYFTAITGKWHCGEWLPEHLPMGQGFMHQYGHYAWGN